MPDDSTGDAEFDEIIKGLGPVLVTDDLGVWDFFHGIIQTWDSLNMADALNAAREKDEWFRDFCADPMRGCIRIADEWEAAGSMPEYVRDWVREQMPSIVHWLGDHDIKTLRLWVDVPGDGWLYMLWDTKGLTEIADKADD